MNRNIFSYSRHLTSHPDKSLHASEVGSLSKDAGGPSTSQNIKLISMLDEEQLKQVPSTEEIWSRRKSLLLNVDDDEGICPCLARIFREQLEEMKRILPARGSVDLSQVSQIDKEQTERPRRSSLPSRYVSVLDREQKPQQFNYEVVLKAYLKMKRSKCRCKMEPPGGLPEVNIIPSTPRQVQESHLGQPDVEEILPQVATDTVLSRL